MGRRLQRRANRAMAAGRGSGAGRMARNHPRAARRAQAAQAPPPQAAPQPAPQQAPPQQMPQQPAMDRGQVAGQAMDQIRTGLQQQEQDPMQQVQGGWSMPPGAMGSPGFENPGNNPWARQRSQQQPPPPPPGQWGATQVSGGYNNFNNPMGYMGRSAGMGYGQQYGFSPASPGQMWNNQGRY